jgi:hypothetical protein
MNPPDRTAIYRVSRNGHVMGEFDIDRVAELLDAGEFLWTDLYWAQGMSEWASLTSLRPEVLAARAFPPVAAVSRPVSSGRRGSSPVGVPTSARPAVAGIAGWWWLAGSLLLGCIAGLVTTRLFPKIVEVDRPVEKIVEKIIEKPVEVVRTVEKPVEVVRMVDKIVEVPAVLTPEQQTAILFTRRLFDSDQRRVGVSLFKLSDKVKVYIDLEGEGASRLSRGLIQARVETAFRRQGFKVLAQDSEDYPFTVVEVGGVFLENKYGDGSVVGISGSYQLEIRQPLICFNPWDESGAAKRLIMGGNVKVYEKAGTLKYGLSNLYKVPDVYERMAEEASNDLRKAQDN